MKRLAAILLSGSLVCALSVLGGAGTAANNTAGAPTASDTPTVIGGLLNPAFFAHGAYVMQGVSDPARVFALPLLGVPEIGFFPTAPGIDPSTVTWRLAASDPEGISAEIRNNILYIWGNNATWAGYGAVTLTASAGGETGSVTIPVTVFHTDKTHINADGKKDYFVPWLPQLDINRILSVEEHMRKYNKDEGQLDRTVRWSGWQLMTMRNWVYISTSWSNSAVTNGGWNHDAQYALVDVLLDELHALGVDTVRVENAFFLNGRAGSVIYPVYEKWNNGPTKTEEEVQYIVNEAHRRGMWVIFGNTVAVDPACEDGHYYEIIDAAPLDIAAFWEDFQKLTRDWMETWRSLGVEVTTLGGLDHVGPQTAANRQTTVAQLRALIAACRGVYPGIITDFPGIPREYLPGQSLLDAPYWADVDILSAGILYSDRPMTTSNDPTVEEVAATMRAWRTQVYEPFQKRWNKPFWPNENGCFSLDGAISWGLYYEFRHGLAGTTVDISDMETYYRAHWLVFRDMPGYMGPGWYCYDFHPERMGGVRDGTYNPRLKVDALIQELFTGQATPRVITIDGTLDDWNPQFLLLTDDQHSAPENDIAGVWATTDDTYLYLRLDFVDTPTGDPVVISLDTDGNGVEDCRLICEKVSWMQYRWYAPLTTPGRSKGLGFADIVDAGDSIELRVHWRFLGGRPNRLRFWVTTYSDFLSTRMDSVAPQVVFDTP